MHPSRIAASLLLLASTASSQALITVDDDGPADHADLPAAMAAATDGDVVLVSPGTYNGFTLDGKAVNLEGQGAVTVVGTITIRNLSVGRYVALRGVDVDATAVGGPKAGFVFEDCDGAVHLEDCDVIQGDPAADLIRCADVAVVDCVMSGQDGSTFTGLSGSTALRATDSSIALHGGQYFGGRGASAQCLGGGPASSIPAEAGHAGISLFGSVAFLENDVWPLGGDGGDGCDDSVNEYCMEGGDGGNGLHIDPLSFAIDQGGAAWDGGGGGSVSGRFGCFDGWGGSAWGGSGPTVHFSAASRGTKLTSPAPVGGTTQLSMFGETGDAVFLLTGVPAAPFQFQLAFLGVLAAPSFLTVTPLGVLGAPAVVDLDLTLPDIAPLDVAALVVQGFFVATDSTKHISAPSHITVYAP